jgi:hypothetical protein
MMHERRCCAELLISAWLWFGFPADLAPSGATATAQEQDMDGCASHDDERRARKDFYVSISTQVVKSRVK